MSVIEIMIKIKHGPFKKEFLLPMRMYTLPDCYRFDTYQHRHTIHSVLDLSNEYFKNERKVEAPLLYGNK